MFQSSAFQDNAFQNTAVASTFPVGSGGGGHRQYGTKYDGLKEIIEAQEKAKAKALAEVRAAEEKVAKTEQKAERAKTEKTQSLAFTALASANAELQASIQELVNSEARLMALIEQMEHRDDYNSRLALLLMMA